MIGTIFMGYLYCIEMMFTTVTTVWLESSRQYVAVCLQPRLNISYHTFTSFGVLQPSGELSQGPMVFPLPAKLRLLLPLFSNHTCPSPGLKLFF